MHPTSTALSPHLEHTSLVQYRLSELIRREHLLLRHQRQVLIRRGDGIVVQALDVPVMSAQGDVVEAGDSEAGLRVRGGDEAALCGFFVSNISLQLNTIYFCEFMKRKRDNLTLPSHQNPLPAQLLAQPLPAHKATHDLLVAQRFERLEFAPVGAVDARVGGKALRLERVAVKVDDLALEEGRDARDLGGASGASFARHVEGLHGAGEGHGGVVDAGDGHFDGPVVAEVGGAGDDVVGAAARGGGGAAAGDDFGGDAIGGGAPCGAVGDGVDGQSGTAGSVLRAGEDTADLEPRALWWGSNGGGV